MQPQHSEESPSSPGACGAIRFPMEAALLTPDRQTDRQQGWSHSSEVPAHSHPRLCCLGPVCCRFVSYIKKPVRLNTLRELVCAPEQSLLLSLSDWRRAPMVPRAGTGDVDSSTSNPRNINCFLWHLLVTTIGNEKFSQAQTLFCNST